MRTITTIAVLLFTATAYAQHNNSLPGWIRDERLSDKRKIEQLERKASYEQQRAASFASRGIQGYKPSPDSLKVSLPQTHDNGIRRLEQLNRIHKHLSAAARAWKDYEFDVVMDRCRKLSRR